jgi:hydrogenase expression/formation protein HypE
MSGADDFGPVCPVPLSDYKDVTLAHGEGGALTHKLIEQIMLPAFANDLLNQQHDGAVFEINGTRLAFTTDSYVVRPYFFPGGDIGMLAVNGTVNDLAMCGARPLYLSAALILEEGLPMADLQRVVASMQQAASAAGVQLVTGDTKVVDKGSGDGVFVNVTGIGVVEAIRPVSPSRVGPGDAVILSGDIGRHGMAVMSAREGLEFEHPIESDTAALHTAALALIETGIDVHCLRDPTRGGLATSLVEIAEAAKAQIAIDETVVPVSEVVRGACEILGFDPLYVANEGRFIAFVAPAQQERALEVLQAFDVCRNACVIGVVSEADCGIVTAKTAIGGQRVLDMLSGAQLPRIC